MKSIKQYICEEFSNATLNNVKVVFDVEPKELILQVPDTYDESAVQQYISDRFGNQFPGDEKIGEKKFGENYKEINDAYFEYDAFIDKPNEDEPDLEWDANFDSSLKAPSLKLVKVVALRYIMLFEKFIIQKSTYENSKYILDKIFRAAESNAYNKYPVTIKYNRSKTELTEV